MTAPTERLAGVEAARKLLEVLVDDLADGAVRFASRPGVTTHSSGPWRGFHDVWVNRNGLTFWPTSGDCVPLDIVITEAPEVLSDLARAIRFEVHSGKVAEECRTLQRKGRFPMGGPA